MADDSELSKGALLALVESAQELTSEFDLSALLDKILERACRLTSSESASIILTDAKGLFGAAAVGPKAADFMRDFGETAPTRIKWESKAGRVFVSGEPLINPLIADDDPEHFKEVDRKIGHKTESMACVPLETGTERIGVVQILNKPEGNYSKEDEFLLIHLATHAALAIRNARLVQELLAHKGMFTSPSNNRRALDLIRELSAPAHEEYLTVMFADMRGFTSLTRDLNAGPLAIEQRLNQFLKILADEVIRYDGLVNKFLGDGVLALFRGRDSEIRAVRAAFAILAEFDALKADWFHNLNEVFDYVDVGIGIATGQVVIGAIGSGRVRDFTALGAVVNLAAAFENLARGGKRVLINQGTLRGAEAVIEQYEELPQFELRKPDQPHGGTRYHCYHVVRLRPAEVQDQAAPEGASNGEISLRDFYRSSWAIIVGVNIYASPEVRQLSYAIADVRAVSDALPALGFPSDKIKVLENENATKQGILNAILGSYREMDPEDRLLVFFALHGEAVAHPDGEEGYLLPYDADPSNLLLSGLPMVELAQLGGRLPPKHVLFVVDACFSGFATTVNLPREMRKRVIQVMTAGTSGQYVAEENGHGVFTRAFLTGLEGAADPDGAGLTAVKLSVYIQDRLNDKRQSPQFRTLAGQGDFQFLPPKNARSNGNGRTPGVADIPTVRQTPPADHPA